jgi:hypothetical protein
MATYTSSGWTVGDTRRLTLSVASSSGAATNSDITLLVRTPSGAVAEYVSTSTASAGIDHFATGSYRKSIVSTEAGDYRYLWRSTGVITQSTQGRWAVAPPLVST